LLGNGKVSTGSSKPEKPMPVKPIKRKKKKKSGDEGCLTQLGIRKVLR
jgi:hypothetical protein